MSKRMIPKHLHLPSLLLSIGIITLLSGFGIWSLYNKITNDLHGNHNNGMLSGNTNASPSITSDIQITNGSVSPLLFGTNMSLFDSNDQVLQSANTRNQLQQMHFRIIRMPVRPGLSNDTEIQAAQAIKSIGAYALVVLRGAVDNNVLDDDTRLVNDMNSVFGNTTVFYEYGNEEDLLGVNVSRYTDSWNTIVPQLKRIALHGQFIGPVNFHYDQNYLTAFLQQANPRPDQVSWHEYACDDSWSPDACISHIDNWTAHIRDARSAMIATTGTALPIMITEWNYAPNAHSNDGKINNSGFMSAWTTKALATLAANRIFASMQYACTNSVYALIRSDGTPTAQALVMQTLYQRMILSGQQPTPVSTQASGQVQPPPTSNPTVVAHQHTAFSFEDGGIDGWSGYSKEVSLEQNSSSNVLDGSHSLRITLTDLSSNGTPYILSPRITSGPQAGQTLNVYLYLPNNSVSFTARVFAVDSQLRWLFNSMTPLAPGVWNHLTYTLPTTMNGQLYQLGIQFSASTTTPMSSDVFIDAVGWN